MSLEDSINNLASAIDKLATALPQALFTGDFAQPVDMSVVADALRRETVYQEDDAAREKMQQKRRGRPPGSTNKAKEEPAPTAEPVEEASESEVAAVAPEPEVETTIDDLRKALMALRDHDKGDKSRAVKAMRDISGVEAVPEVPPQFYAAIVAKCKELMA